MTALKNYYNILGINHHATRDEIRIAYRSLAKIYHPDKNNNSKVSEEQFKEVLEAYRVLSDEAQRNKYDLKLKYGLSYTYTARAQQAKREDYKKYGRRQAANRSPSPPPKPKSFFERHQITLSFAASIVILYFISRYSAEHYEPKMKAPPPGKPYPEELTDTLRIQNADSPYDSVFGPAVSEPETKNLLAVVNNSAFEAIVCLVNIQPGENRVIRNEYIRQGTRYTMNHIPDGMYYLKIYFGKNWDPEKPVTDKIRGAFRESAAFVRSKNRETLFIMKETANGENISFSSYETSIHPGNPGFEPISAKEFFNSSTPR